MPGSIDRIRQQTAAFHARLETTAYAQAVLEGAVPLSHYSRFLRALHILHTALEQALQARTGLSDMQAAVSERRAVLETDLAFLTRAGHLDEHAVDPAALHALVLAQQIRLTGTTASAQLWGHLYVLEGSQLGGAVQAGALARQPGLRHGGFGYLERAGQRARAEFEEFLARLERAIASDERALEEAITGAQRCFSDILAMLEALNPRRAPECEDRTLWLGALNPEAGAHSLPTDVREVDAALRAGEQSYRAYAYYRARYHDRGLRYTRSDSAWLATLAGRDAERAVAQVAWLGRVLAVRGMPTFLLREHLHSLHGELVHAVPERASRYAVLLDAAAALPATDKKPVPADVQALAPEQGLSASEAFVLVQGAVCDERAGYSGALPALMTWLADPQRFSAPWVRAMRSVAG